MLTPLAFDPGHPFPHISNLSKNLAVVVKHEGRTKFARVKLPPILPRFLPLPPALAGRRDHVRVPRGRRLRQRAGALPRHARSRARYMFRVIRDTDMVIQEDEADDLLETIDQGLRQLRHGAPSLLQVEERMPRRVLDILVENFEIRRLRCCCAPRIASASATGWSCCASHRPELKDRQLRAARRVGPLGRRGGLRAGAAPRLHAAPSRSTRSPSVETFLRAAVADPHVVAIKMTLYRIGHDSPLIDLLDRGRRGRQAGGGARRAEGALRRAEQHHLGEPAGGGRRARRLRPDRT